MTRETKVMKQEKRSLLQANFVVLQYYPKAIVMQLEVFGNSSIDEFELKI
jgi:hypothetical protein